VRDIFADTFYFFAILNTKDPAHSEAIRFSEVRNVRLITTIWILTELADGLARSSHRSTFQEILDGLLLEPQSVIVPPSQTLFDAGVKLYNSRTDKTWSLTDCISFIVMEERGLTDVLTGDRHFEQAGFQILLPSD
jgi:predicted nucleic acid-binding protein